MFLRIVTSQEPLFGVFSQNWIMRVFWDFKNEFTIPYDISMFEKELDRKDYVKEHIQQINEIQKFFLNNNSKILEKIRTLAKVMHNAKNIYWLTSTSTTRMVEDMQMQFLRFNSFWGYHHQLQEG